MSRWDDDRQIDVLDPDVADWRDDPWDSPDSIGSVERLRRQTRLIKWGTYLVMCLTIVGLLIAGGVGWWYVDQVNPDGEAEQAIPFTVTKDDTVESISMRLEGQGVIEDAGMFRWYVDRHGGLELTPGFYEVVPGDHMGDIMGRFGIPPSETNKSVTFPEGYTLEDIARQLQADTPRMTVEGFNDALATREFRADLAPEGTTSLEGLLFPDTYEVSNAENEANVIARMITNMERVAEQEDLVEDAESLGRTPYEILIIASMIEREAKVPEDRPMIARVIYNRLARNEPLQIDATLLYGQPDDASVDDLVDVDTPYNTYMHLGLPPTPIANPGRASIQAALNPAPDPSSGDPICIDLRERERAANIDAGTTPCIYLFYVLSPADDGSHVFAATGAQHQANVDAAREAGVLE